MMVSKKSLILAGATLALLGASASAQSQSGKVFRRYNKPLKSVSVDMATGTITRGPAANNRAAGTTADFANLDLGPIVAVDTGNGFCEWFDAAVKGFAGNASDLMDSFIFAYCSASLDPASGGPGGSVKLGFYEGYTLGNTTPTTTVAAFTLTGLPGNTISGSIIGGSFSCYFIGFQFVNLVAFADGPIGYSWKFQDLGTTGVLAATFPIMSCISSCSGTVGGTDGQGMTDFIDQFCPPGSLRATFTFGTSSGGFPTTTSMSMQFQEASDFTATLTPYNASLSPNGDTLATSTAVIGNNFTTTLTRSPATGPGSYTVQVRPSRIPLPNGVPPPPPVQGRFLISGPILSTIPGTHNGTTGSTSTLIPAQLGNICLHFACQAVVIGGGVKLSSAVEGTTGTQ